MAKRITDLNTGDLIRIKVGGIDYPFKVLVKNHINYVPSAGNGVLVICNQVYVNHTYTSRSQVIPYINSEYRRWLNSTFYNSIDSSVRDKVKSVLVPSIHYDSYSLRENRNTPSKYTPYKDWDKVFVPSRTEIAGVVAGQYEQGVKLVIPEESWILQNGPNFYGWYVTRYTHWTDSTGNRNTQRDFIHGVYSNTGSEYSLNVRSANTIQLMIAPMFYLDASLNVTDTKSRYSSYDVIGNPLTWDAYDITFNSPPTVPASIYVPATVKGGNTLGVSWGTSTDPDNNLAGYRLERQFNNGTYAQIYSGPALSHTDSITKGWSNVRYRVKAFDAAGAESGYRTSDLRTVNNNTPPQITCSSSGNIGVRNTGFSIPYSVRDAEGGVITIRETMDGVLKRSYTVTLAANGSSSNNFDISDERYFLKLLNGTHTMVITATDSEGASATHTITFTKAVYTCTITLARPLSADANISRMVATIVRDLPEDAQLEVLATNNANDGADTVWEDITNAVLMESNYLFKQKNEKDHDHAFNFKLTASRGSSNTGGFIRSIGGAFE